jgi:hypothetical protein
MRVIASVAGIASLAASLAVAVAAPDEASLLAAWEAAQRGDPKTVTFKRLGERRYRFATSRFPFDGELVVLNLSIDALPVPGEAVTSGVVEVELAGAGEEFRQKYLHSYASWTGTHQFYWDAAAGRWLDRWAWARHVQGRVLARGGLGAGLVRAVSDNLFWIAFFALLLVFLGLASQRANRQMKAAMAAQEQGLADQRRSLEMVERSLRLNEESNRLLGEILEQLRHRQP